VNIGSEKREEWEQDEFRLTLLTMWRCIGKPEKWIAKQMGVSYSTLRKWKDESSIIREALAKGTEELASEISGYMVKRARGYEYTETKTIVEGKAKRGGSEIEDGKMVKQERITKHNAPDVGAQIFLLTNLQPDVWKNTQRVSATIDGSLTAKIGDAVRIVLPSNGREELVSDEEKSDEEQ
jgi:hypothetical protein